MSAEPPAPREASTDGRGDHDRFVSELRGALALASASDALLAPSPLHQLLDLLVRAAARAIPSPEGALFLVDHERGVLTFDVVIGSTAAAVKELTVPLGHGIAGLVAVSGQPLAIANAREDPRHARDVAAQSGYLPTTVLAVPVVDRDGTVVGVLELLDRQGQPTYDLHDVGLLGDFAQQAAIILEHRRAHASLAALVGRVLASLGGLPPEAERTIAARAVGFAAEVEADPSTRQTVELAGLVAEIAGSGPAGHRACRGILEAFAEYLRAVPAGGTGLELLR